MDRAVFLDRDNTIIHNDADLGDPEGVRLIQGAASAIASLGGLGYRIVVISNQGGVARGSFTEADVEAVNRRIAELVYENSGGVIDRFYYCPYHPEGIVESYRREHPWRKPQPGMLHQAAEDLELDLEGSWTIGDQERDVQAGRAAGTRAVLLRGVEPDAEAGAEPPRTEAELVASCLTEAVRLIAQQPQVRRSDPVEAGGEPVSEPEADSASGASESRSGSGVGDGAEAGEPGGGPEVVIPRSAGTGALGGTMKVGAGAARSTDEPGGGPGQSAGGEMSDARVEGGEQRERAEAAAEPREPTGPVETVETESPAALPDGHAGKDAGLTGDASTEAAAGSSASPPSTEADGAPEGKTAREPGAEALLGEILRELRRQREYRDDFSLSRMLAGMVQMLVIGFVVFALLTASGTGSLLGWLLGAILAQLVVLALLIVHGQR